MLYRVMMVCVIGFVLQGCGGGDNTEGSSFTVADSGPYFPDNDGDGVRSNVDQCSDTTAGATVDANGCSQAQRDDDNDGVVNGADQCAATDADAEVDANGCAANQRDTDGDSVMDDVDQCANTPSGETADAEGCSEGQRDDDNDGLSNALDQCPATPGSEPVNDSGCGASQIDTDGDAVNDSEDVCAATPADIMVDNDGCSIAQNDPDGDSVARAADQCPNTASGASVDANGCSDTQLANNFNTVMKTDGRFILDSTGEAFQMRGVNLQYGDNPSLRLGGISPIAEVGANTVRLQIRANTTAAQLRAALDAIVAEDMVAMVMLWEVEGEITCTEEDTYLLQYVQDLWLDEWLPVLTEEQYQPYLLLNIANEWGPMNVFAESTTGYDEYISTYSDLIADFRNADLHAPIVIDAPHCGQDWYAFMDGRGQDLIDADPDRNIILSVHGYNFRWDSQDEVDLAISQLNSTGYPYVIGEFGGSGVDAVDHLYLMEISEAHDIGWLIWSWKGNGAGQTDFDMSLEEDSISLTPRGEDAVNSAFGLANTSELANFVEVGEEPTFSATGADATQTGDIVVSGTSAELRDAGGDPVPALRWNFSIPSDGDYQVSIAYTSDNDGREQDVIFDGGTAERRVFTIAGSPSQSVETFTAGNHTLDIVAAWGYMTIHSVEITPVDYSVSMLGTDGVTTGDVLVVNGTGVELRDANGDPTPAVTWTFDIAKEGDYQMSIAYVSDNDGREQDVIVDGGTADRRVFPIADSPSQSVHTFTQGQHTVQVSAAWGYMTISSIDIVPNTPFSLFLNGTDAATEGDVLVVNTTGAELRDAGGDPTPSITWTFTVPSDGDYNLSIDYVSDNDGREQDIILDGGTADRRAFTIAGSPMVIPATLTAGEHTLEISAAWGYMTLNSLTIRPAE